MNKKWLNFINVMVGKREKPTDLEKKKIERNAAVKKERRTTILTYGIGGAIGILLAVLLYS